MQEADRMQEVILKSAEGFLIIIAFAGQTTSDEVELPVSIMIIS